MKQHFPSPVAPLLYIIYTRTRISVEEEEATQDDETRDRGMREEKREIGTRITRTGPAVNERVGARACALYLPTLDACARLAVYIAK